MHQAAHSLTARSSITPIFTVEEQLEVKNTPALHRTVTRLHDRLAAEISIVVAVRTLIGQWEQTPRSQWLLFHYGLHPGSLGATSRQSTVSTCYASGIGDEISLAVLDATMIEFLKTAEERQPVWVEQVRHLCNEYATRWGDGFFLELLSPIYIPREISGRQQINPPFDLSTDTVHLPSVPVPTPVQS